MVASGRTGGAAPLVETWRPMCGTCFVRSGAGPGPWGAESPLDHGGWTHYRPRREYLISNAHRALAADDAPWSLTPQLVEGQQRWWEWIYVKEHGRT